jgi:small GTP-binding protein
MSEVLQLKLVFVGCVNVGKSCLSRRIQGHQGPLPPLRPTTFADTASVHFEADDLDAEFPRVICHLQDTAGQERFTSLARSIYRGAHIVFLVFAVDDRVSYEKITDWHARVKPDCDPACLFIMVGNKSDLPVEERAVTKAEADIRAKELGFPYFETSAQDFVNVRETFEFAVREVVRIIKKNAPAAVAATYRAPTVVRPSAPAGGDASNTKKEKSCCG